MPKQVFRITEEEFERLCPDRVCPACSEFVKPWKKGRAAYRHWMSGCGGMLDALIILKDRVRVQGIVTRCARVLFSLFVLYILLFVRVVEVANSPC